MQLDICWTSLQQILYIKKIHVCIFQPIHLHKLIKIYLLYLFTYRLYYFLWNASQYIIRNKSCLNSRISFIKRMKKAIPAVKYHQNNIIDIYFDYRIEIFTHNLSFVATRQIFHIKQNALRSEFRVIMIQCLRIRTNPCGSLF